MLHGMKMLQGPRRLQPLSPPAPCGAAAPSSVSPTALPGLRLPGEGAPHGSSKHPAEFPLPAEVALSFQPKIPRRAPVWYPGRLLLFPGPGEAGMEAGAVSRVG